MELYKIIEQESLKLGFCDFGVAKANEIDLSVQNNYNQMLSKGYFGNMQYLERNIEKRFNPKLLVEGAKSVLVFLAPYSYPINKTQNQQKPQGISEYALGEDYHKVIKDKLFILMNIIKQNCKQQEFIARAFTDSAPVLERAWAVKAALGFIGKSNFLISKKAGIKNFIGIIICNVDLPTSLDMYPDKKDLVNGKNYCGNCTKCLNACPTGALEKEYTINANKCISYITIENRFANANQIKSCGKMYFGCDYCLNACPWNSKNLPGWPQFYKNAELLTKANAKWWLEMNKDYFSKTFSNSAIERAGLEKIQQTIKIETTEQL